MCVCVCVYCSVLVLKSEPVPQAVLTALPLVRVRQGSRLLEAGMQCRICLRGFQLGQQVRRLPCHHKVQTIDREIRHGMTYGSGYLSRPKNRNVHCTLYNSIITTFKGVQIQGEWFLISLNICSV